jgi:hypothetical protein
MRDRCPKCGAPPGRRIEHPGDDANELHVCSNASCGHVFANPTFDFEHIEPGVPVAFWMPRERWEALPVYTGKKQGDAILYRDPERIGVVHRWTGRTWWETKLSFEPTGSARHPY